MRKQERKEVGMRMFNKCYMMIGLPGSGKSYEAEKIAERENAVLVSSDSIREEINGNENDQSNTGKVFEIAEEKVREGLRKGRNVIMDSTNISYKRRMQWLSRMKEYGAEMIAVFMATPYEMCVQRQELRERKVPEDVIMRMYLNFYIPYFYEGWDRIEVVYPQSITAYKTNHVKELLNGKSELFLYDQKNNRHKLTLGNHLFKCFEYVAEHSKDKILREAALIHDASKPKIQTFDKEGIAHYYQHQHVTAYDSMFEIGGCFDSSDKLRRAALVQWHMAPYAWKEEELKRKQRKLFGNEFFDSLMILHKGDLFAH